MSYVGDPFKYDVFVSYAHAETETDSTLIRDWSHRFVQQLAGLLSSALNTEGEEASKFRLFLDHKDLISGQPLTATLQEAVRQSAFLLVLMRVCSQTGRASQC